MRGDLALGGLAGLGVIDLTDVKNLALSLLEEAVCELIDGLDVELAAEGLNEAVRLDLVPGEVVVAHVHEARLGHLEIDRETLSLH